MNLADKLAERAQLSPSRVAYIHIVNDRDEVSITYQALFERVRRLADELDRAGVEGQRVVLMFPTGLDFIVALYACMAAGATAVPLPLPAATTSTSVSTTTSTATDAASSDRTARVVVDCDPAVVLTNRSMKGRVRSGMPVHLESMVHATEDILDAGCPVRHASVKAAGRVALIQYTSGSTGRPKGVVLTHANLSANLDQIAESFGHSTDSSGVIWLPHFHDMGLIGGILQPLHVGFPVALMSPAAFVQRPLRWLRAIDRYQATTSGGPNFAYDLCVLKAGPDRSFDFDLSRWCVAFNGAEPVKSRTLNAFARTFATAGFQRRSFVACYGLAEAGLLVSSGRCTSEPSDDADPVRHGKPAAGMTISFKVADSASPGGRDREILIAGRNVSRGYWNRPPRAEGVPFPTGDLGHLVDGELVVTGRSRDLIILRGRNVFAEDIERTVSASHPHLYSEAAAAIGIDDGDGEQLVYLQELGRRALSTSNMNHLIDVAKEQVLTEHGVCLARFITVRLGSLPRTSSGKVSRQACREACLHHRLREVRIDGVGANPGAGAEPDAMTNTTNKVSMEASTR